MSLETCLTKLKCVSVTFLISIWGPNCRFAAYTQTDAQFHEYSIYVNSLRLLGGDNKRKKTVEKATCFKTRLVSWQQTWPSLLLMAANDELMQQSRRVDGVWMRGGSCKRRLIAKHKRPNSLTQPTLSVCLAITSRTSTWWHLWPAWRNWRQSTNTRMYFPTPFITSRCRPVYIYLLTYSPVSVSRDTSYQD